MTLGKRIKSLRQKAGLTQEQLAKEIGYSTKASISKIENDVLDVNQSTVIALSRALHTTPSAIMGWEENPVEQNAMILPQEKIRMIPVYESVSAGFGAFPDNYILDYIPLFISNDEEARNTLCIKVQGNSMYPKIEDGDSIQVLKQDWCDSGQVAVVLIDDEDSVVKKIEYDKNSITLLSFNPEYAPRVFKGAERDRLRILGIVRKIIKDI